MRQLIALFIVAFTLVLSTGCTGEKAPKADPNFKVTTNPSDIQVPGQMKKLAPKAPPASPDAK
jgi:hypothetical protein